MDDREQHQAIADAFAAIRLYRSYYGSGGEFPERLREIARILRERGEQQHGKLLVTTADAIVKGYASG